MRVLLSTYGGRGNVEPLVGLAVRLQAGGAEVRVCAPPDCAERLALWDLNAQIMNALFGGLGIGAAHDGPAPTTEPLPAALKTALT
jgi:vancomycin aglycone glucosyltransferase